MIFPVAELKISSFLQTPATTLVTLVLYRVDDGGLDAQGNQQCARTFKRRRTVRLDAGWDAPRILAAAKERLLEWTVEEGFNLPESRLICTL